MMFSNNGPMGINPNLQEYYRQQNRLTNQLELKRSFQVVHQFNTQPVVAQTIQNLTGMLEQMKKQVKAVGYKNKDIKVLQQGFVKNSKERISRIRKRSEEITKRTLNLKDKLISIMQHCRRKDPRRENEYQMVMEKIKKQKIEIKTKLHSLKSNQQKNKSKATNQKTISQPLRFPITELKDGTQVLMLEAVKVRQQMRILIAKLGQDSR